MVKCFKLSHLIFRENFDIILYEFMKNNLKILGKNISVDLQFQCSRTLNRSSSTRKMGHFQL